MAVAVHGRWQPDAPRQSTACTHAGVIDIVAAIVHRIAQHRGTAATASDGLYHPRAVQLAARSGVKRIPCAAEVHQAAVAVAHIVAYCSGISHPRVGEDHPQRLRGIDAYSRGQMAVLPAAVGRGAEGVGLAGHHIGRLGSGALIDVQRIGAATVHKQPDVRQGAVPCQRGRHETHTPRQRPTGTDGTHHGAVTTVRKGVALHHRVLFPLGENAANHETVIVAAGGERAAPQARVVVAAAVAHSSGIAGRAAQRNPQRLAAIHRHRRVQRQHTPMVLKAGRRIEILRVNRCGG